MSNKSFDSTKALEAVARNAGRAAENSRVQAFNRAALFVVSTFCLYILGMLCLIAYCAVTGLEWNAAFTALLDLLKTSLVPITSTVLGYYIAQSK